jgi:antitoxin (DNA-binding transcriptional repressor) of toxin-antitoxin stability system
VSNVEGGETAGVTVGGIPVARIVSAEARYKDAAASLDDWKSYT